MFTITSTSQALALQKASFSPQVTPTAKPQVATDGYCSAGNCNSSGHCKSFRSPARGCIATLRRTVVDACALLVVHWQPQGRAGSHGSSRGPTEGIAQEPWLCLCLCTMQRGEPRGEGSLHRVGGSLSLPVRNAQRRAALE
eukprot:1138864-Pelagomonas_calceolata.AAC.3